MAKAGVVGIMIALGGLALAREIAATTGRAMPRIADAVLGAVAPLNSFNGYGLFRVMTTDRPEIVIETSDDGTTWSELPFRYKPGDPMRAPPFVAPHMPRLDWQMWFAALDPQRATAWLLPMLAGILEDSGPVVRLLENDGEPPRYVRLAMYRYAFASPAGHNTGAWWTREFVGYLTPPLTRDDLSR